MTATPQPANENTASISIPIPNTVTEITKAAHNLVHTAPHWVCLLAVVGGFLWYLDRHDEKEQASAGKIDQASALRIETCHDVQERSVEAIDNLNKTLGEQSATFREMDETFQMLLQSIDNHSTR